MNKYYFIIFYQDLMDCIDAKETVTIEHVNSFHAWDEAYKYAIFHAPKLDTINSITLDHVSYGKE